MTLLDSGTTTMTGGADPIMDESGPMQVAARFDFSELTAGDTVVIRYRVDMVEGGLAVCTRSWEIVQGTTTGPDWVGAFGDETAGFETPVLWFVGQGHLSVEQTVGSLVDVKWEIWRL